MRQDGFLSALGAGVFAVSMLASGAAHSLDARFTDANGDMVADVPTDARQLVDPSILIFAYTPVEDPAVYAKVWDSFLQHLAKTTGKRVQFFPVQSNAAQIEAMRAGRLHVAGFNTGATPLAVSCSGFVPFTMMAALNGDYGYQMEIISHPGSGIAQPGDIKGKKMAFTAETSNSGYKAPAALLREEFRLEVGKDYQAVFSGKHDNSILGVANKDYPAAAIASTVLNRMLARNVVKREQLVSIYKSKPFPTTAYGHAHNLKPELAATVRDAFATFQWEGSALLNEFKNSDPPGQKFMPITYKENWTVVRQVDEALGVKYACK